jgi:signal transduction histidine kinase
VDVVGYLRRRWEQKAPEDLRDYPWWLPVYTTVGITSASVAAVWQRAGHQSPWLLALAFVLCVLDPLSVVSGRMLSCWVILAGDLAGVGLLLSHPVSGDLAPVLLVFSAAKITAGDGVRPGMVAMAAGVAELVVADAVVGVWGFGIWIVGVVLGFDVGFTMRWQLRALTSERARLAAERDHAAAAERQRIARDVHDLVAHSLSVTMLHVTGARLALSTDRDVDEAIDALTEAERVGRQTMAEIRSTVAVLSSESAGTTPLPGVGEIDELVERMRSAGLAVAYERVGEACDVPPTLGVGLYRITQESLSNIAKHAPDAPASVRLELLPGGAHLQVRNPVPPGAVPGSGAGLPGMAERAEQLGGVLHAGPRDAEWLVDLLVPSHPGGGGHECLLVKLRGSVAR